MIHHIAIGTNNLEKMVSFYEKLPNLIKIKINYYENEKIRSVWFQSEKIIIMIEENEIKKAPLVLVFNTISMTEIIKLNLNIKKKTDYTLYFDDPDGNLLGFSSYPNIMVK